VFDTIIPALAGADSSFPSAEEFATGSGYVTRGHGVALLVSNGFAASDDRAVYRFVPRSDQITVRDTLRTYTVDSAAITVTIIARDTLVTGLKLFLYRIPSGVDSTVSFTGIDPLLTPATLIDSIVVPDSVHTGTVNATVSGAELSQIALAGADSTLAIALGMSANTSTGVRVGSRVSGTASTFTTFVTVDIPDTGSLKQQAIIRPAAFNTFVTREPVTPVDSLLTVGGEPSSRALVRFALSNEFLDSVSIVRATMALTPVRAIIGLPTDPTTLLINQLVGDLGAKSPITSDTTFIGHDTLASVQADTIKIDVTRLVQLWQSARERPKSVFLRIGPALLPEEGATFARPVFFSTRSHGPDPSVLVAPRIRITYQRSFPFENP
jgi:hypothetical protein